MIIVMPNNTTGRYAAPAFANAEIIGKEMVEEIMPFVEARYRTINDRAHRATAGLSFGGGTAMIVGMRNLDKFASVAEFGTGLFGTTKPTEGTASYISYDPDKIVPNMYAKLKAAATKPRLFYMSVGEDDGRKPNQVAAYEDFRKNGINPVFQIVPGDHEYKAFRASLADLLPRLFR
jgi:enterochelin esterase family protein